ncbi:hypothetical protein N7466_000991 [Penicillium verhagenii]|uniref:uncharacterized protein n=1 Tax=Penicillium verhagenii TaxID=1562060 RepID=UPI0025456F15|nr:uncharacterized protein N7466_000991 [Penicillium verhagenii]KAJ5947976.1 hypothetical protein N7466_000991 [Penicillium verhagenii]
MTLSCIRLPRTKLSRIFSVTLWLLLLAGITTADQETRFRSEKYAHGFEGAFPLQRYSSAGVLGPILNYWETSIACDDGLYTIIAPRGGAVHHSGPMILDKQGHLVWFKEYETTYNANVYTYKGERYLTFWAGDDLVRGHGEGIMYMLNSSYEEAYKLHGVNGVAADLHEFHITRDDTAVFTVYDIKSVDLTSTGGSKDAWIYDGVFQEIDVETNELLFEWRASEHFSFSEVERDSEGTGDSEEDPWDWFHINSVDKDEHGNFLISSRYLNCLAYISGTTGSVIWKLGGKESSFTDISAGSASNISWQHHARFQPQYDTVNTTKVISIFDNSSRGKGAPENPSRGLIVDINEVDMTVAVRAEYWHPLPISSQSQGSMQVLENGHVLLGYGYSAAWTEFGADGEVLCDVHFGPSEYFQKGDIISYRTFKQKWVGLPLSAPDVALSGTTAAVTWNGATEVATWVLQGSLVNVTDKPAFKDEDGVLQYSSGHVDDVDFEFISAVPKTGFETRITIPPDTPYRTLRIVALDATGTFLRETRAMEWVPEEMNEEIGVFAGSEEPVKPSWKLHIAPLLMFAMGFMSALAILLCAWLTCRCIYPGFSGRAFVGWKTGGRDDEWEAVRSGEELDDLDDFSDLESGERDEEHLLNNDRDRE